jgi:hypothetical protein
VVVVVVCVCVYVCVCLVCVVCVCVCLRVVFVLIHDRFTRCGYGRLRSCCSVLLRLLLQMEFVDMFLLFFLSSLFLSSLCFSSFTRSIVGHRAFLKHGIR